MNSSEKLDFEKFAGLYTDLQFPIKQIGYDELYNDRRLKVAQGVDTYWIKYPVRTGYGQRHSITAEGGDENMVYSGGLSYNGIEGTMKGSSRRTLGGNIMFMYKKGALSVRNDLQISSMKAENSPYESFDTYTKVNSYYTPYDQNGNLVQYFEKDRNHDNLGLGTRQTVYNPLYDALLPSINTNEYVSIINNFGIDWEVLPKLLFRLQVGINSEKKRSDHYIPIGHSSFEKYSAADSNRKGKYTYGSGSSFGLSARATVNYHKVFNKVHLLSAGIGLTIEENKTENITIVAEGIANPKMDFIGAANQYEKNGSPTAPESTLRSIGGLASITYTYDHRYFVDANGKYEGSSQFGSSQRFAPIWSVGMGWNIHRESFMQHQKLIDVVRLRASYGVTGTQAFPPYLSIATYKLNKSSGYDGWHGMNLMQMNNENLKWQQTKQINLGVDLEMINSRIRLVVDVYDKLTDNLISDISLPTSSGFPSYKANIGEVQNRGIEVDANIQVVKNKTREAFSWNLGVKVHHNKNEIKKISNSLNAMNSSIGEDKDQTRNPSFLFKEGESMKTIFVVKSKGIDPSNGREVFVKLDGTETYIWNAKDRVANGVEAPKVFGNINTTLRYNGFSLSAYFSYRFGGQYYNQTLANKVENIKPYENADKRAYYDRWKEPGDVKMFKAVGDTSPTYASSRFVMDDNSFSCANLTVGYDLPKEWSKKYLYSHSVSIKAYFEELFYISSIKQERGTAYPYAKKYSLSIAATF